MRIGHMQTRIDRNTLVKHKGRLEVAEEIINYNMDEETNAFIQRQILEVIGNQITEDSKQSPLFDGKDEQ